MKDWSRRALLSRLEPMRKFVATLREHQEYILPYLETGALRLTLIDLGHPFPD